MLVYIKYRNGNHKETNTMNTEEVLTSTEAAKYLKTTKPTLFRLVREGRIKANRLGRDYRFLKEELDKFLRGGESEN